MTLRDQRVFVICLGGCDSGAQSCCPRGARDDGLTDPDNGLMRSVMPVACPITGGAQQSGDAVPLFGGQ
jgi:hypothetical protein